MSVEENTSGKQKSAEGDVEDFRDDLGPFVVAAETTRMPMIFTSAKASGDPIIFVNQAFLTLTGFDEHELLGRPFRSLIESGTDLDALVEIQTAFDGGRDLETSVRYCRKNGDTLWVMILICPVRDEDGTVVQHFASFMDITRQKDEEEERLLSSLTDLHECRRSTIDTVRTIAEQTLRGAVDDKAVNRFLERITAVATEV